MAHSEKPWYSQGLRFACTRCGACCTGVPGHVWISEQEVRELARFLGVSVTEAKRRFTKRMGDDGRVLREQANGDCIFFDRKTRECTVYDVRPAQCRTWPFWPSNLRTPQAWVETCQTCPGAGTGRLFSVEEILEASRQIDP